MHRKFMSLMKTWERAEFITCRLFVRCTSTSPCSHFQQTESGDPQASAMWTIRLFLITAAAVLFLPSSSAAPSGDVSHEDIRDAILSLVTIFRDNSDKLERHEYRERQLGEQLKKALAGLDKRYRSQDQIIGQISEKLKTIEAKMNQNEAQNELRLIKITDAVDNMQKNFIKMMKDFETGSKGNNAAYTVQDSSLEAAISAKLDKISSLLPDEETKQTLKETEKIVRNIEHKLKHTNSNENLSNVLTETTKALQKLPERWEIREWLNDTFAKIEEVREDLIGSQDSGAAKILMRIDEKTAAVLTGQEDLMKTTTDVQSMAESLNDGVSQNMEQLLKEVKGLAKVEQVMIQTADNVMDTKRRIEYGVHQILLEVGDLVKHHGKSLNGTVNKRFDDIETTILDNQTGALSNLTTRIETEISQVWRQIGIMYQQLTTSATALDRLQQQTDVYVNGSAKTMDSMENKVGLITSRMTEVDENLNFLLGKLSMVTSEYNQIKSGLAGALDDIRDSFLQVQSKLKDVGPGPRPIIEDKEIGNEVPSG